MIACLDDIGFEAIVGDHLGHFINPINSLGILQSGANLDMNLGSPWRIVKARGRQGAWSSSE
jgi:hypothetical protein